MRRLDDTPLDPEIEACLDAIDATLAGEPVEPRHAELAELALLLADQRPLLAEPVAHELDARVARRFAPAPAPRPGRAQAPRWRGRWAQLSAGALAAAGLAAVAVVLVAGHSSGPDLAGVSSSASSASASASTAESLHAAGASGSLGSAAAAPRSLGATLSSASSAAAGAPAPLAPAQQALSLPPNGRKVVQSAEVDLQTAPNRIETVAQEVFDAVGAAGGIVDQSSVTQTGGSDGSASFALRVPSANLAQTMARLSALPGAQVLSRTDSSQDVNSQYVSSARALADAQALRAALLKQLAAAVTTGQIDSLQAQIHSVEATIASDQAAVNALNAQIDYSRVTVTISARPAAAPVAKGGFTFHRAAHIAGRVLVVAAGVALIALAALVPVGLLAAALAWVALAMRRRRREQALDLA